MNLKQLLTTDSWAWPEDSDAFLIGLLRDASASEDDVLTAAELAGDHVVASDEMAEALLGIACDPARADPQRAVAAASLGSMLDFALFDEDDEDMPLSKDAAQRAHARLQAIYQDDKVSDMVRRRALEATARKPQPWHRDAIRQAFEHPAENWRSSAVFCMGYVRGFKEEILRSLNSPSDDIRYCAVVAAGNHALEDAWDTLCGLLEAPDTEKDLLLAAIDAVVEIRPGEAYEVLHPLLESGDDDIGDAANEAIMLAESLLDDDFDDIPDEGDEADEDATERARGRPKPS